MNNLMKGRILAWAVVLLLLANVATIFIFWMDKSRHQQRGNEQPDQFIIRELAFDNNQQQQFRELVKVHRERAEQLRGQVRNAKDRFFSLLQQPGTTDSMKSIAAGEVSKVTEQLDILTFEHFQQVRALCNSSQQKKFDDIIQQVLRTMGGPGPGPGHGPPPGAPPPPHE